MIILQTDVNCEIMQKWDRLQFAYTVVVNDSSYVVYTNTQLDTYIITQTYTNIHFYWRTLLEQNNDLVPRSTNNSGGVRII